MERFIKGDIVVLPFPFSDLSSSKKRPALVIADLEGMDIILCQITSQDVKDKSAISWTADELQSGKLIRQSNIRPNRIFTVDKSIILYKLGSVHVSKQVEVRNKIVALLDQK
jgi:mRNA interferase MazF